MRAALAALLLAACGAKAVTPTYHADANPETLSDWGAVAVRGDALVLGEGVVPYALNTPLFTDYAHKLRTVWVPEGSVAPDADGDLTAFPVGTVISKTFYYPTSGAGVAKRPDAEAVAADAPLDLTGHRLIETRLLVRREAGWQPVSYVWNEAQTEATLKRTGAVVPLTLRGEGAPRSFAYVVPNENQCAGCHAPDTRTAALRPLGPTLAQLDRDYAYAGGPANQLTRWREEGLLTGGAAFAPMAAWDDASAPLGARARGYLDANCAHCHAANAPADTSGLMLDAQNQALPALGVCKTPIAAGAGTGGHAYAVVPGEPDASILAYRLASDAPGAMMPELGRSLVHEEGVALIEDWIAGMEGGCDAG